MHSLATFLFFLCAFQQLHQISSVDPSLEVLQQQQKTWQDAFKALGISWNPNGTLNRSIWIPMVDPTPDFNATASPPQTARSQDVRLSWQSKATVRLYIPAVDPPKSTKLPLIIYLHGGDFVLFSAATAPFHDFCNTMAATFPAVVVSVEHRLAPESRLPAAYDDALAAILWLRNQSLGIGGRDPWLDFADFSRTFLVGSSSGANIAYHAALRAVDFDLMPIRIKGLVLNQGFFGGMQSTQSEIRLRDDPYVALYVNHVLWSLVLPKNLNRDHEFCNPLSGGTYMGRVYKLPRVFIKGDYGDPLVDRSIQLARFLQSCNVPLVYRFNQGGYHSNELTNASAAQQLFNDMRWFVNDVYDHLSSESLSAHASF